MTRFALAALLVAGLLPAGEVRAAGGQFDVDDASLVDPQHCQVETWLLRAPGGATGVHLGPACRFGPVELGLNLDRQGGASETTGFAGPQVKWVAAVWPDRLSAGLVWAAALDLRRGGRPLHTVYVPATVTVSDRLAVNLNLGTDWDGSGASGRRVGASAEWAAGPTVTVLVERGRVGGTWSSRLGGRLALTEASSIDLSIARIGPQATRVVGIGFNHVFAR
jgi:hypothetical protein